MNDPTHDDSSYVLDRAITYYRGWSIERQPHSPWVIFDPDDRFYAIACRLEAAREAIDAAIERGEVSA